MLNWINNTEGFEIPYWNGKMLASFKNPVSEAQKWFELNNECMSNVKNIIIFGLGAGFHINELLIQTNCDLFIVEKQNELKAKYLNKNPNQRIIFLDIENQNDLMQSIYKDLLSQSFAVLKFWPAIQIDEKYYNDRAEWLTARSYRSLMLVLKHRESDKKTFEDIGMEKLNDDQSVSISNLNKLNIKNITSAIESSNISLTKEVMIWKTLRELVK